MTPVRRPLGPDDVVLERVTVPPGAPPRLDQAVAATLPAFPSRGSARKACDRGEIAVNGVVSESARLVSAGDELARLLGAGPPPAARHEALRVIHEDPHLAVIDKPSGMPTSGRYARTVARFLPGNLPPSAEPDALAAAHPVHRLDAPTSGLLLVARTRRAQVALGRAFEHREVEKGYRALCLGTLTGEGTIEEPIDGRTAVSRWRALSVDPCVRTGTITTVALSPETGRTHQLRRHLAAIGHPILGDGVWSGDAPVLRGNGLFLVADRLAFHHPIDGRRLEFSLPEPSKFASFRAREARRVARLRGG